MTGQSGRATQREDSGLPERRLTIRTGDHVRHVSFGPRNQILAFFAVLGLLCWTGYSTVANLVVGAERDALAARVAAFEAGSADAVAEAEARHQARVAALRDTAQTRIDVLTQERDAARAQAEETRGRLAVLTRELDRRQARLMEAADAEAELSLALETLRAKLSDAVIARDSAERERTALSQEADELRRKAEAVGSAEGEWTAAIAETTRALEETARQRDAAAMMQAALTDRLETLETDLRRAEEARGRLFAQLEDAVQAGLGGLETVFVKTGLDLDRIVGEIRRDYSGEGGPFIAVDEGVAPQLASTDAARVASLMGGLERASLMQVAAAKLPLASPVKAAFRFTSGFGVRHDPINGRSRMHSGTDFAARTGTPIHSTAEGVVTFAGWQSGYGRVVKIRHAFGFETVYAHMSKTHVKVGDRVARDGRIGDMGNTGRSTGTHLHYEIRLNGKPMNPMKYIEAARNVL